MKILIVTTHRDYAGAYELPYSTETFNYILENHDMMYAHTSEFSRFMGRFSPRPLDGKKIINPDEYIWIVKT